MTTKTQNTEYIVYKEESNFKVRVYKLEDGYCGEVRDSIHKLWSKDFKSEEKAIKKSLYIFKSIVLADKYLSLSEKYYQQSRYYYSIGDEKEEQAYLKKTFLYKEKYDASKGAEFFHAETSCDY